MLLYPIQFDCKPMDSIDRVLGHDVFAGNSTMWPKDVIAALDAGLASKAKLAQLIPMTHSEKLIRSYLATLRKRLDNGRPTVTP